MVIPAGMSNDAFASTHNTIEEMREEIRKHSAQLQTNTLRITANYELSSQYKGTIREQARFITNTSQYTSQNIVDQFDDINSALNGIQTIAEAVIAEHYKNSSLSIRHPNRAIAAENVLKEIAALRNSYAVLKYFHGVLQIQRSDIPTIPNQQPAPIRVEINENHLDLDISQTLIGSISESSLDKLRSATQELLDRTINQIGANTNVDPRLVPNLSGLNSYLSHNMVEMPIEALGLNFQFARRSFLATKDTVPDPLAEQIDQVLSTVNVILNQYEEWRQYISAETALTLSPTSMQSVLRISQEVEEFFENNENLVEPKLINRLREITDAYSQGLVNLESAAVPLIESLGNIFSELSRFVISQSPAAVGSAATSGAVILFLGFAIKSIETFTPTLSGFPPLSYLIDVQKFAHKQYSLLKDSFPGIT